VDSKALKTKHALDNVREAVHTTTIIVVEQLVNDDPSYNYTKTSRRSWYSREIIDGMLHQKLRAEQYCATYFRTHH
jgi:hypothetical protein